MVEFLQLCIVLLGIFVCGVWFGASGLKAMQEKQEHERLEQQWQDWLKRNGQ